MIIPEGVKKVPNNAFRDADGLILIELPESLETIGDYAFAYMNGLLEISMGSKLSSISGNAFDSHNADLIAYGPEASYAQNYCNGKGITFSTEEMPWPKVTVSSRIIDADYDGVGGVMVSFYLDGNMESEPETVTTNALGQWRFTKAMCGRTYHITYEKAGYDLAQYNSNYTVAWENCAVENIVLE